MEAHFGEIICKLAYHFVLLNHHLILFVVFEVVCSLVWGIVCQMAILHQFCYHRVRGFWVNVLDDIENAEKGVPVGLLRGKIFILPAMKQLQDLHVERVDKCNSNFKSRQGLAEHIFIRMVVVIENNMNEFVSK